MDFVARAYNKFDRNDVLGTVRKSSTTPRLKDEILYYLYLNKFYPHYAVLFPRLMAHSQPLYDQPLPNEMEYWMDLEKYAYPNLGSCIFSEDEISWNSVFGSLRAILNTWKATAPLKPWSEEQIKKTSYDMYINKTETEYAAFVTGWANQLGPLLADDTIELDSHILQNFHIIWPSVKEYIMENMLMFTPSIIHGDCCFSNILYGKLGNVIRFVDPRGSFGVTGIYGDIRYDIAKLYHSVEGAYEAYIYDRFRVNTPPTFPEYTIELMYPLTNRWSARQSFNKTFFPEFSEKDIKIITGTIFTGMCARHFDSLERQKAMFITGIRLLNEAMDL